jgi:hypothetical protein
MPSLFRNRCPATCWSLRVLLVLCSLGFNGSALATPDWSLYNTLLSRYVVQSEKDGTVYNGLDYSALGKDPRFAQVLNALQSYPVETLSEPSQRIAFYINAYNIFAIKMVVDHYPLESIRDVGSFLRPVWDRTAGTLNSGDVTLDQIEHDILRTLGEPRVHFAIVCASVSCPDLRAQAFESDLLSDQLDEQVRGFLNNPKKGLELEENNVRVSKIFDWFEEDFEQVGGAESFIRRYRDLPARTRLRANLDYDWSLNDS